MNLREFNFLPCILFGNIIVFQGQCVQVVWQRRIRRSAVVSKFEFVRPGWEWLSDASRIAVVDGFTEVWTPWNLQSSPSWPDGLWNGMLGDREREEERKKEDI